MKMTSFAELTKQVHLINDLILSDMTYGTEVCTEEALRFSKHLLATKYWFTRISWANKRRYVLTLLHDVRSAWAISLLLKCLWNCQPKDAVLSISEVNIWSSYDQVPMDHNRTAQPVTTLAQVMNNDRKWFHTLEPESQAVVLSELLTVAGGPVMWEVLRRAQRIYEKYRTENLESILECVVVNNVPEKVDKSTPTPPAPPAETPRPPKSTIGMMPDAAFKSPPRNSKKELETSLAAWNAAIKSVRDNQKLEEFEMIFNDGTKRKIWKVNRVKPEITETVDFVQLLPLSIGMRIISFLPNAQLLDYAKVNRYWAYLIDEFRAEVAARQKLGIDQEKLQSSMLKYDTSMEVLVHTDLNNAASSVCPSIANSVRQKILPSMRPSEKSAGAVSFKQFIDEKLKNPLKLTPKPIRNLAEITKRLERRGAADENLWVWCENVIHQTKRRHKERPEEGVLRLGEMHFPCPMMKQTINLPLFRPLRRDPANAAKMPEKRTISNAMTLNAPKDHGKHFSLWSRDFSSLYKVFKVASYQSPV